MNIKKIIAREGLLVIIILLSISCMTTSYASWPKTMSVDSLDFDGDFMDEIVVKTRIGAGTGLYLEKLTIYKDVEHLSTNLQPIFIIDTLFVCSNGELANYRIINDVTFIRPYKDDNNRHDIIVKSRKITYKGYDQEVIDKKEDLGTFVYKWDDNSEEFICNTENVSSFGRYGY